MENIRKFSEKLNNLFSGNSKNKIYMILFAMGIIGILLIFFSELLPDANNKNYEHQTEILIDYSREQELERKLEKAISQIDGAGKTSVMLTFGSSPKYYYAVETTKNIENDLMESEEKYVVIENNNKEEPIVIKVEEACIRGAVVICEGGNSAIIKEKITETVCAVLGIKVNQVSVAKMA